MTDCATYIEDGYSLPFRINAEVLDGKTLYGSLSGIYRPSTRRELITLDAKVKVALQNQEFDDTCAIKAETFACEYVVKKIVSWDLINRAGEVVKIDVDALYRVHPQVFAILYNIIRGRRVSDTAPDEDVVNPETQAGN